MIQTMKWWIHKMTIGMSDSDEANEVEDDGEENPTPHDEFDDDL
jgi:hypothetical protein